MNILIRRVAFLPYLLVVVLSSVRVFQLPGGILNDPFHHGEYFATLEQNGSLSNAPIYSIHGAVDWIPAYLARSLVGKDSFFGLTAFFYQFATLISLLIFIWVLKRVSNGLASQYWILLFGAVFCFSAIDYRDLGVFISLFVIFYFWDRKLSSIHYVVVGAITYFSFFWYYTRGLISIAMIVLFLLFRNRHSLWKIAFWFVLFSVTLPNISTGLGIKFTLDNILVIRGTTPNWRYTTPFFDDTNMKLIYTIALFTLITVMQRFRQMWQTKNFDLRIVILTLLSVGYIPIATYRADLQHALMMTWPVLLLVITILANKENRSILLIGSASISLFCILCMFGIFLRGGNHLMLLLTAVQGFGLFLSLFARKSIGILRALKVNTFVVTPLILILVVASLFSPKDSVLSYMKKDSNRSLVSKGMLWVSDEIVTSGQECLFDFTNQGLIAGLTSLPNCTKYGYPMYVPTKSDKNLRDSLKLTAPTVIVSSSNNWSYAIDGKSMAERYPITSEFIRTNYPYLVCKYDNCLAYSSNPKKMK